MTWWILIALRHSWYHLKGLLKGFWWPFRLSKLVKYSQSYGPNEVCNKLQDSWTSWMLEDVRAGIPELLVALDIEIYRTVHQYLWSLPTHQTCITLSSRQVALSPSCRSIVWHNQHQLYGRAPQILWMWCSHNNSRLDVKKSPLCSNSHNSDYGRSSKAILPLCLKGSWAPPVSYFGPWTVVCCPIN